MRRPWLILLTPLLVGIEPLKRPNRAVEDGNARLKAGKADEALQRYDEAARLLPTEAGVQFDRGAALAALGRHDEAGQAFLRAIDGSKDDRLKQAAFYNLGNSFARAEKFAEAVEAYKRALALDPNDVRAKWNLELALKKKKDADDKKKNQQGGGDGDKQPKQDQKQDQQPGQGQQGQQDQGQDQGKDEGQPKPPGEQPPSTPPPNAGQQKADPGPEQSPRETPKPGGDKAADTREMDAVLDSLERSPKDLEKFRARIRAIRRQAPEKDW